MNEQTTISSSINPTELEDTALESAMRTARTIARLVKVALLTSGHSMTRRELHGIINLSRPSWKYTNGEMTDALHLLRGDGQVTVTGGPYFDSGSNLVAFS